MPVTLDQLLVLATVLAAVGYLVWRSRRKTSGCGSCSAKGCAADENSQSGTLVQIETRPRKRSH